MYLLHVNPPLLLKLNLFHHVNFFLAFHQRPSVNLSQARRRLRPIENQLLILLAVTFKPPALFPTALSSAVSSYIIWKFHCRSHQFTVIITISVPPNVPNYSTFHYCQVEDTNVDLIYYTLLHHRDSMFTLLSQGKSLAFTIEMRLTAERSQ